MRNPITIDILKICAPRLYRVIIFLNNCPIDIVLYGEKKILGCEYVRFEELFAFTTIMI